MNQLTKPILQQKKIIWLSNIIAKYSNNKIASIAHINSEEFWIWIWICICIVWLVFFLRKRLNKWFNAKICNFFSLFCVLWLIVILIIGGDVQQEASSSSYKKNIFKQEPWLNMNSLNDQFSKCGYYFFCFSLSVDIYTRTPYTLQQHKL